MSSVQQAKSAARVLVVVGATSVLNAFLASLIQAEHSYETKHFTNTHWITSVVLFAGIAVHHCSSFTLLTQSFTLAVVTNIFAFTVALAAVLADLVNVAFVLRNFTQLTTVRPRIQVIGMITYSTVDLLLCGVAIPLTVTILRVCLRGAVEMVAHVRSKALLALGATLGFLSGVKFVLWTFELFDVRSSDRFTWASFLHFTIDEPVWISVNIAIGLLCGLSSQGGAFLRMITFILSALSVHPTILYLWVDYRFFASTSWSDSSLAVSLLLPNVVLGFVHVLLLIAICFSLILDVSSPFEMKICRKVSSFFLTSGGVALVLSVVLFLLDILSLRIAAFYRLFHGSEQKTPFLVFVAAVLLIVASRHHNNYFALPAALAALLYCIQSTSYLIFSYIYLSWNGYFAEDLCEYFYMGAAHCNVSPSRIGAVAHFVEAFLYAAVFLASLVIAFVIHRLFTMHSLSNLSHLSTPRIVTCMKYERYVEMIGNALLLGGAAVLALTVYEFFTTHLNHPMLVLVSSIYRLSLGTALLVAPLYQVLVSRSLLTNPLNGVALTMISALRFSTLLTELDYRYIGKSLTASWHLQNAVETLSLGAHFATIMYCLKISELSSDDHLQPDAFAPTFTEFHNPLADDSPNEFDEYLQVLQNGYEI